MLRICSMTSEGSGDTQYIDLADALNPNGLFEVVAELRTRIEILQGGQRQTLETLRSDMKRWLEIIQSIPDEEEHENVIILGATGSGKSTLLNIMCGKEVVVFRERGPFKLRVTDPLQGAEQGQQHVSHTVFPCGHVMDDTLFIDCPGLLSNQDPNSIILNAYGIRETLKHFSPFKLLILLEERHVTGRATSIIEIANEFGALFNLETIGSSLTMICSQQRDCEIVDIRDQIRLIAQSHEITMITERGRRFLDLISGQDVEWVSFRQPIVVGPYNTRYLIDDINDKIRRSRITQFISLPLVIPERARVRLQEFEQSVVSELQQFVNDFLFPYIHQFIKTKLNTCTSRVEFEQLIAPMLAITDSFETAINGVPDDLRNVLQRIESHTEFLQSIHPEFRNVMRRFEIDLPLDVDVQHPEPGVLVLKGIFVTLQDIINNLRENTHTVHIYAVEGFVIHVNFTRPGLNIVLFARRLITDGSHIFTLSGRTGSPGGSVYCEIANLNTPGFRLITNGGNGIRGRDGANGVDGVDANRLVESSRTPQVKTSILNDRHGETFTLTWTVFYHGIGAPGTAGGSARSGSLGASGGIVQSPRHIIVTSNPGQNGEAGVPGIGGRQGRCGLGIEDWSQWHGNQAPPGAHVSKGWSPAQCTIRVPKTLSDYGPRAPSGGIDVAGIVPPPPPKVFTQAEITAFKTQYRTYWRMIKESCSFVLDEICPI